MLRESGALENLEKKDFRRDEVVRKWSTIKIRKFVNVLYK